MHVSDFCSRLTRGLSANGLGLNDCGSMLDQIATTHGDGVPTASEIMSPHAEDAERDILPSIYVQD